MAEDLDQIRERFNSSKLSDADVQVWMNRLTIAKDASISIDGNVTNSVLIPGDNNQVTLNQGLDFSEVLDGINHILVANQDASRRELLDKLNSTITDAEATQQRPVLCSQRSMLITSIGIGVVVSLVRFLAGLQGLELWALDGLMALQHSYAKEDSRILVVAPDDVEVQQQGQEVNEKGFSFTDDKLAEVLKKIQNYHPTVIGLDLERPFAAKSELAKLLNPNLVVQPLQRSVVKPSKNTVKQNQTIKPKKTSQRVISTLTSEKSIKPDSLNLVGGCKALETQEGKEGRLESIKGTEKAPPPEIAKADPNRIGFVDFAVSVGDQKVFRRQILAQEIPPHADKCRTIFAFSTLVSKQFLSKEHGYNQLTANPKNGQCPQFLHLDSNHNFVFPYFNAVTGGFQGGAEEDRYGGCQILLNYGIKKINTINLTKLLNDNELEQLDPKPQIILIGSAARSRDFWITPLGVMEGAKIQALTVSQIVDTVLGKQRLIWAIPEWTEFFWILSWSLLGGLLGWRLRFWKPWFLSLTAVAFVLCVLCSLSFWVWQLWLPLIPPMMTLLTSAGSVAYLNFRHKFGSSNPFQILRAVLNETK